ncbi:hypothetical protein [Helicobacter marmotae]|uniref:Lipoprotein n=1 Tax=Helicobacter marmotae TaxID=152490 RepID=A0A3D8I6P5_9HELI|nr:hypothetical protein [Helicobacter marmotae]RDU60676.1 hypothetical protein CQA63_01475 [Helicobacter marmotae]
MSHSRCFHKVILAYLAFIFAFLSGGCGYKAAPFYQQTPLGETSLDSQAELPERKEQKILFQEIDSKPAPSHAQSEE